MEFSNTRELRYILYSYFKVLQKYCIIDILDIKTIP